MGRRACEKGATRVPLNLNNAEFVRSAAKAADFPRDALPQIVFAGRSNVGKSSVINRLLGRKNFARVGNSPGKTTHINYFLIDKKLYLVDLPGYGYAKVSQAEKRRWSGLMEGYFSQGRRIALVVQIVDFRHAPTEDDQMMVDFLRSCGTPFCVVATKSDKLNRAQREEQAALLDGLFGGPQGVPVIPFSSLKGEGVAELQRQIALRCEEMAQDF